MAIIYHNPRCSTSRAAIELLHENGIQPEIVEYLKQPLNAQQLTDLIAAAGLSVRDAMRSKENIYTELGLDSSERSDQELIAAMVAHPVLLNRPFVVTAKGTRLARPLTALHEIL